MTYDIYCYKATSTKPDIDDAKEIVEGRNIEPPTSATAVLKIEIAKNLVKFNPRLESVEFEFAEIAAVMDISVEEARKQFNHIELNTYVNDTVTQIRIFDNLVCISVPYWYTGKEAAHLFKNLNLYLKVIGKASGYYVYDPQTIQVFDPSAADLNGLHVYERISLKQKNLK